MVYILILSYRSLLESVQQNTPLTRLVIKANQIDETVLIYMIHFEKGGVFEI